MKIGAEGKSIVVTICIIALLTLGGMAFAGSATIMSSGNAVPYTQPFAGTITIASAFTSTGAGAQTATTLGVPMSNFSCAIVYSGISPTTSTVDLEGSIDGTYWRVLSSTTTTLAAGNYFDSTGKWASRVRLNHSVMTKATGTTIISYRCIGQQ